MLCALRMMAFSQAAIKVNSGSGDPKVSKGRSQTSSVLTALWSPPQRRNPCLRERSAMVGKTSRSVAPIWRDNVQVVDRAAWGRVCGRAKLLAGMLRCLRLCGLLLLNWSPVEQLGRCPKPQQGRCPCTLQGADEKGRSPPLDPFWAPRLERVSAALWDSSVKPGSPRPSPIPQSPHPRYTDSTAAPSAGQYPAACSEYPLPAHSHWQSPAA